MIRIKVKCHECKKTISGSDRAAEIHFGRWMIEEQDCQYVDIDAGETLHEGCFVKRYGRPRKDWRPG